MKWTGLNELREMYLSFFEKKQHLRLPSFPLVPAQGDKSLLLINSGMAPMKKWFLAEETPPSQRVTTCQKCIRTPDIESVGITARHGTFFEMLGNFSFQDYFKRQAIAWAWEFFTAEEWLAIPPAKLHISVYEEDDEAFDIWTKEIGVEASHMARLGKKDNFWEHGSGPCGPCSEIHFDRGEEHGCGKASCGVGCECDRFMEVWNLVFTEFNSNGSGKYTKLANPNIDTGMGLERLACVMQGAQNLFETDTVKSILQHVEALCGKKYGGGGKTDISIRVITDHIRSTVFMVGDGILPSNEGRGYVLRRLLRRAARHGNLLGINKANFLTLLCSTVIQQNQAAYPALKENEDYIKKTIAAEEERFAKTIQQGLQMLGAIIDKVEEARIKGGAAILSGTDAFRLNDTFGFPLDLTREIAKEAGLEVDIQSFQQQLQQQRQKAREDRMARDISGWEADLFSQVNADATEFLGYTTLQADAQVVALSNGQALCNSLNIEENSDDVLVVLNKTPFYAESGGQVADTGKLVCAGATLVVKDVKKTGKGFFVHVCFFESGSLQLGNSVNAQVNTARRQQIMGNHTAAHLLQQALRQVLGGHIHQAGSYVDANRLRFDFTHFSALSGGQLRQIEDIVNAQIFAAQPVATSLLPIEQARQMGAIALFGEKYGSQVRVVSTGGWSVELCGGTHVANTANIGCFKITAEASVAAGVRRIEATTGQGVLRLVDEKEALLQSTAAALKITNISDLPGRVAALAAQIKQQERHKAQLEEAAAKQKAAKLLSTFTKVNGVNVYSLFLQNTTADALRSLCDEIKAKDALAVAALAGAAGDKISLAVCCGPAAVAKGFKAGEIVKQIAALAGGSGGGRPDFAMAGLKDKAKVETALAGAAEIVAGI